MAGMGGRTAAMGLAGGMGAAAMVGGAYYATAAPMMEAAEQFGAGAQNVSDVGMLAQQHMGPQFGQPGARPGGGMGRTQVRQMVGVLEELAGDDSKTTMETLKRLMDSAGESGMLQGIGDAQQFKQKFEIGEDLPRVGLRLWISTPAVRAWLDDVEVVPVR